MIVWAQGISLRSHPSRYHYVEHCWINTHQTEKRATLHHKVFETTEEAARQAQWWPCPYCDPPATDVRSTPGTTS